MIDTPAIDVRILRAIADHHLPGSGRVRVTRMQNGVSTPVYCILRHGVTRYLRLAESPAANLAPEAFAHAQLHRSGVRVPEVLHFDPLHQDLGRSLMITGAIPGCALAEQHRGVNVAEILRAAGQDLARIQELAVAGFGFVRRDLPGEPGLVGATPSIRSFALADLDAHLADLTTLLTSRAIQQVRRVIEHHAEFLDTKQAVLAHGDLDATHIYHQDGHYSGIIDFGEMRGADRWYDLGHLALHEREIIPCSLLPSVLAGYAEIAPFPPDDAVHIQFWSLLIGLRALARSLHRHPSPYQAHLRQAIQTTLQMMS